MYDAIAHNQHVHFDFFCRCLKSLQTGVDYSDVFIKGGLKTYCEFNQVDFSDFIGPQKKVRSEVSCTNVWGIEIGGSW